MILDRVVESQNLSHKYLCAVSAKLFPKYTVRYLVNLPDESHISIYIREGLEKVTVEEVAPEIIKLFPVAHDRIKLQMAILLNHFKDIRFLEDIYRLLDQGLLPNDMQCRYTTKSNLCDTLEFFPDECTKLIESLWTNGEIRDRDLAIRLLGWIGNDTYQKLLQKIINDETDLTLSSSEAMGRLRIDDTERLAMDILAQESDFYLKGAAIESLGHLQSTLF